MFRIRQGEMSDLAYLPEIERAAARRFSSEDLPVVLREHVLAEDVLEKAQEAGMLWVAVDEVDQPVGFALVAWLEGWLHLVEMDVLPTWQGKGMGGALLAQVEQQARVSGAPGLSLTTFRYVLWNAAWYQRKGFVILEGEAIPPSLQQLLAQEAVAGLDPLRRVAMRKPLKDVLG